MTKYAALIFAGSSLLAITSPALAQGGAPQAGAQAAGDENADSGAIIVTARRKSESLQDVPSSVSAVTGDTIDKLHIVNFNDIQQVVPGLNLNSGQYNSGLTLRGVSYILSTAASSTVQFYLNDAPGQVGDATFDIGQIEVLRGPQGTSRGKSSPSGSITATTKTPDLNEIGGYVNASATNLHGWNGQGAINVPLIKDVLAVRFAAVYDATDANGVRSVNNTARPYSDNYGWRGTLLFRPSDNFKINLMYQGTRQRSSTFTQVAGTGRGFNGPVITAADRLGVGDQPTHLTGFSDLFIGQAELRFAGQKLSYIASYQNGNTTSQNAQDTGNLLPNVDYRRPIIQFGDTMTHELRLESVDRIGGFLDYTVGAFYADGKQKADPADFTFLAGAFGRPDALPVAGVPNPRYTLPIFITIRNNPKETSFFGSLTAHIGDKTELTAGGRYIISDSNDNTVISTGSAFNAFTSPFIPLQAFCPFAGPGVVASPVYTTGAAVCDFPITASTIQTLSNKRRDTTFIYNLSASHKFSGDFMAYATASSSFRAGPASVGLTSLIDCCTTTPATTLTSLRDLVFHDPEKSSSIELGFKSSFLEKRGRLNAAIYQQTFKGYFFYTQPTYYLNVSDPTNPSGGSVGTFGFTASADAKVTGVDIEASLQITPRWNFGMGFSWSDSKLSNALVPCNDGNFDGTPDNIVPTVAGFLAKKVLVARCRSNDSINRTPKWNLTAQSEYTAPLSDKVSGFLRGNFVYYPSNPNASPGIVIDGYALLDLYAGVRSPDGTWEVSVFARNATNTSKLTGLGNTDVEPGTVSNFFGPSRYTDASFTQRRMFGLNLRYAFGSR